MVSSESHILIIGAGTGGIRAALSLAESGHTVTVVEKSAATGGILPQLDRQFPNDHCGMCRMLPMIETEAGSQFCLKKGILHKNINVLTLSEVVSLEGIPGQYQARVSRIPTGINHEVCSNCLSCVDVCPVGIADTVMGEGVTRKAVYSPVPFTIPGSPIIDWKLCDQCGLCLEVCRENAINLNDERETIEIDGIDGVIVASGTSLFDPSGLEIYGINHFANVVTSIDFERMRGIGKSSQSELVRPSDGKTIQRIAWIQCVGSRNLALKADYCSSACCMISVKQAVLSARKMGKGANTAIFYMDMRTYGRDFQRYRDQAEQQHGVKFIRCRIHSIEPGQQEGDLQLRYLNQQGEPKTDDFDLVVLAVGQASPEKAPTFESEGLNDECVLEMDSTRNLKDISSVVVEAEATAGKMSRLITKPFETPADFENVTEDMHEIPDGFRDKPRIQVIIESKPNHQWPKVNWDEIRSELERSPYGVTINCVDDLLDQENMETIIQLFNTGESNRLLIVTCRPNIHRSILGKLIKNTAIVDSVVELLNLSFLFTSSMDHSVVDETIIREIKMILIRLSTRMFHQHPSRTIIPKAIIVGSGPAGLSAALALADHNLEVTLVERKNKIGGNLDNIFDPELSSQIKSILEKVRNHPLISIHTGMEITSNSGLVGNFKTLVQDKSDKSISLEQGVIILATGGVASEMPVYGLGKDDRVVTQHELEKRLNTPGFIPEEINTVVMIQCANSREEPNNYCSRICCTKALKNAIQLKEVNPGMEIHIFYRDIMTYGPSESLYTEARRKGILFYAFDTDTKPEVIIKSNKLSVSGFDRVSGKTITFAPDLLGLAYGILPTRDESLDRVFGLERTSDGFIKEADSKWRPIDTNREGIFVSGMVRSALKADEALEEGEAAAQRAMRVFNISAEKPIRLSAHIRHSLCTLCKACIEMCSYHARFFDPVQTQIGVDPFTCQACGVCATTCLNGASQVTDFEDNGLMNAIEAAL